MCMILLLYDAKLATHTVPYINQHITDRSNRPSSFIQKRFIHPREELLLRVSTVFISVNNAY